MSREIFVFSYQGRFVDLKDCSMRCIHPELPGQFDGEEVADSEEFHLCFGSVAGSGCRL